LIKNLICIKKEEELLWDFLIKSSRGLGKISHGKMKRRMAEEEKRKRAIEEEKRRRVEEENNERQKMKEKKHGESDKTREAAKEEKKGFPKGHILRYSATDSYKIIGEPMIGGMGIVYPVIEGEDIFSLQAAKTFQDEFALDDDAVKRFINEAKTWVNLGRHPNIVRAHFVSKIEGRPYIFMDFMPGGSLGHYMAGKRDGILDIAEAVDFAMQFCAGMSHAGRKYRKMGREFAHRDIKPGNCLLSHDKKTLKITDFGLSKVYEEQVGKEMEITVGGAVGGASSPDSPGTDIKLTATGSFMGTCPYMPPEHFEDFHRTDVRGDIYSFGVMFFQMLTGRFPFIGRTPEEFYRNHKIESPPDPRRWNKKIPDDIIKIIYKCIEKKSR